MSDVTGGVLSVCGSTECAESSEFGDCWIDEFLLLSAEALQSPILISVSILWSNSSNRAEELSFGIAGSTKNTKW
jgi:hypothetical protein